MTLVVSNTSPLRALAHLGLLDVLNVLYGRVLLPPAVEGELMQPPPGQSPVIAARVSFLQVRLLKNQSLVQQFLQTLDPGESETLALALQVQADGVLIDERNGRAMAQRMGLRPIGVLGILLEAKRNGLIGAVAPLLDRLVKEIHFFASTRVRAQVLRLAGELP